METKKNKRGDIVYQTATHIILIAIIFAVFFLAATSRVHSKVIQQQILEKQTALLIDAASSGMTIVVPQNYKKQGLKGYIQNIELKQGRVFVYMEWQGFSKGYPYFSRYDVSVEKEEGYYYIRVR